MRLSYFLLISQSPQNIHWGYKSLITYKNLINKKAVLFNSKFLLKQLTAIFNLVTTFLYQNYNFFVFNSDFLINDIYSFSKWVYGVKTVLKYNFIFNYELKKFRNFRWKKKFLVLVKKKKIKLAFLLDMYNNLFLLDFLKNSKLITIGLVPQNQSFSKLDFWCISNTNSYIIKYLYFSYLYSIYNIILLKKSMIFFKQYGNYFNKYLYLLS